MGCRVLLKIPNQPKYQAMGSATASSSPHISTEMPGVATCSFGVAVRALHNMPLLSVATPSSTRQVVWISSYPRPPRAPSAGPVYAADGDTVVMYVDPR